MATYIHGTAPDEQQRLVLLNELTNPAFLDWLPLRPGLRVPEVGSGRLDPPEFTAAVA